MDAILAAIAAAARDGASDVDLRRGAVACRALADALDAACPAARPNAVVNAPTVPTPLTRADVAVSGASASPPVPKPLTRADVAVSGASTSPPRAPDATTDAARDHPTSGDSARPGRPPSTDAPDRPPIPPIPPIVPAVSANPFAGMSADQVLDLAISKLRDAVGEPATALATSVGQPFRLTLVPIPRVS
ncbi:MAG: hypothetical protein IPL61_12560 [Myxococcales bacterium]|nr:hypothetical protein [Myxococcales bacterium]